MSATSSFSFETAPEPTTDDWANAFRYDITHENEYYFDVVLFGSDLVTQDTIDAAVAWGTAHPVSLCDS